jgi:hypothetical protein
MHMLAGLRAVRAASSVKGAALLLVVVQDGPLSELPPDRLAGLRSNLSLEQRCECANKETPSPVPAVYCSISLADSNRYDGVHLVAST